MSSPAVQLSFTLRTSPNVKTVHLVGTWDGYQNQLPLSVVRDAKPGSWKGTFRFQGSHALKLGSRYWYYYIVDGYHVSHDPAKEYTTEPTTGRKLNVLDVPASKNAPSTTSSTRAPVCQRQSRGIATGRSLSPGKIQHPRPSKPYASRQLREADYSTSPDFTDDFVDRFAGTKISDRDYDYPSSPASTISSSSGATFSDAGSGKSSPRSLSSVSSVCTCARYGITRSGQKVKLDCGGSKCGYSSGGDSECSESESEGEEECCSKRRSYGSRRQGTYVSSARR